MNSARFTLACLLIAGLAFGCGKNGTEPSVAATTPTTEPPAPEEPVVATEAAPEPSAPEEPPPPEEDSADVVEQIFADTRELAKERAFDSIRSYWSEIPSQGFKEGKAMVVFDMTHDFKLRRGSVLFARTVRVIQVTSEKTCLVEIHPPKPHYSRMYDPNNPEPRLIHLMLADTSLMEVGRDYDVNKPVFCSGTYRYETVGGSVNQIPQFVELFESQMHRLKLNLYLQDASPLHIEFKDLATMPKLPERPKTSVEREIERIRSPSDNTTPLEVASDGDQSPGQSDDEAARLLREAKRLLRGRLFRQASAIAEEIVEKHPEGQPAKEAIDILKRWKPDSELIPSDDF